MNKFKMQVFFQIFFVFVQIFLSFTVDILRFLSIIYTTNDKKEATMLEKIKNAFTKETPKAAETKASVANRIPKSQYSFVEQYVIADPNKLMHGGYELWSFSEFTPVAYEEKESSGWLSAVQLPTIWVQPFLKHLKQSAPEIRKDPTQRLISVTHLADGHKLYIVPNLKEKRGSVLLGEHSDAKRRNDWMYYVTPEINRAIVEQAKIRSRG